MHKKLILFTLFICHYQTYTAENSFIGIFHNIGGRSYQEDRYDIRQVDGGHWFGIYDGHGGNEVSEFLVSDSGLADIFSKTSSSLSVKERLKEAFATADQQSPYDFIGSTASIVYIKDGIMHFAHVGDSRAIIPGVFATSDHKPDRDDERQRITRERGRVSQYDYGCAGKQGPFRVNSQLAVSRAIGDHSLKKWVIPHPEYTEKSLEKDCSHLVIGSDGLYDVMSNDHIAQEIKNNPGKSMQELADILGNIALKKSKDNITVMVIYLQKLAELKEK